ncbi:aminotransferase class I and II [Dethiosulfovibrio peptidovorans DSM 11002]|uniref:Aminotransferase class I and II n=1 Tax=Dethiosulfovibrio peptidovorans DSM 11002 TaxID=469381 RepID=D2Z372_9BACT|nr:aminotransferase class I/II-fold pyridoxal phosphate-dependent enzyme [Dethiosulfovibrio peptidovorans]EFC92112.1 aminotransferase class I and II [Dethiosulfovibrio peptidovorans DSM 11002]
MSHILRLDKNECPYSIPSYMKDDVDRALLSVEPNRYPDPTYGELRQVLGDYVDFPASSIVPGNGGDEILWMIFAAWIKPGDTVLTLNPSFSQYEHMCKVFNARHLPVPMVFDETVFKVSVDEAAFIGAIKEASPSLILLDSPNNPSGTVLSDDFINSVVENSSCPVIVDEAYGEFASRRYLDRFTTETLPERVSVLKTMSKAWGIAGLRVGCLVTSEKVSRLLNDLRSPFNVNVYSEAVALTLLKNRSWLEERIKTIVSTREKFRESLAEMSQWKVLPSEGNFLLVDSPIPGDELISTLRDRHVEVKRFNLPWEGEWIRITVGTDDEMNRLLSVMEKL